MPSSQSCESPVGTPKALSGSLRFWNALDAVDLRLDAEDVDARDDCAELAKLDFDCTDPAHDDVEKHSPSENLSFWSFWIASRTLLVFVFLVLKPKRFLFIILLSGGFGLECEVSGEFQNIVKF